MISLPKPERPIMIIEKVAWRTLMGRRMLKPILKCSAFPFAFRFLSLALWLTDAESRRRLGDEFRENCRKMHQAKGITKRRDQTCCER